MKAKHNILIVDDHELARDGIALALLARPEYSVVANLENGAHVVAKAKALDIDIVILDLNLPDVSGLDILIELVNIMDLAVVVLTGENRPEEFDLALKVGAKAVVSKSDAVSNVLEALDEIILGNTFVSPQISKMIGERIKPSVSLSPRQTAILHYLAAGETNKEISYRLGVSAPTVSFHLRELREKLGVRGNKKILNRASELGLIN